MSNLIEFTKKDEKEFYKKKRFGMFYKPLKASYNAFNRIRGKYSVEDQLRMACMCEPPMFFLKNGVLIPHAYGITLSVDSIGADCYIGQNVTIGTNAKNMNLGEKTPGHKPKIGNLVRIYANSVISGEITIGDYCLIAAGSFVDKDVPSKSIVYGINKIKNFKKHHIKYLEHVFYHCYHQYKLISGLVYKDGKLYIDNEYKLLREELIKLLGTEKFFEVL